MVAAHAAGGELERFTQLGLDRVNGGLDFGRRHLEGVVGTAVEGLAVAADRSVALAAYVADDALHGGGRGQVLTEDLARQGLAGLTQLRLARGLTEEDGAARLVGAKGDA